MRATQISQNIEKLTSLLECPRCHGGALEQATGDDAAQCSACGARFTWDAGYLDLLGEEAQPHTLAQRFLQSRAMARGYAYFRDILALIFAGYSFEEEIDKLTKTLGLRAGDTVLDVACGHGNFTAAIARSVKPGLVLGLDISQPMLEEAVANMHRQGLDNVVLIRGDVHNLPFGSGTIAKINCSGGFHQFPELDRAVDNIYRVLSPGGLFSGSSFTQSRWRLHRQIQQVVYSNTDLHFLDLAALGAKMTAAGFAGFQGERSRWFGYFSAQRQEEA